MNGLFTQPFPTLEPRVGQLEQQVNNLYGMHDKLWKWFVNSWRQTSMLSAKDRLAYAGRVARLPIEFRSQMGEDLFLWNLFEGKLDGVYIEVGAFDGYNLSVSYAFDAVGWDGILIEPVPPTFEQCRARRPNAHVVNAALSRPGSDPTTTFLHVLDDYGGVLSHIAPERGHNPLVTPGQYKEMKYQVPVRTMDSVLDDAAAMIAGRPIDFASIDVEGHERELLEGFSLSKWKPRVVMLEDMSRGEQGTLQKVMEQAGYRTVFALSYELFFIHETEKELLRRAADVF